MAAIELESVSKRFDDGTEAVRDLSLGVADGEVMVLVGPSGCGKSTALRMIAGLEDVSSGELRIGTERVNERPPRERDVAMVFQSYALYPHMSVRENMGFALKLAKVDRAEIDRKVERAAELLDLESHLDRRPANLSGGQRQRVAMGRAIVREPKAFLMDEPLSNLDAKLRVQMRMSIAQLQRRLETTTVYVTHDQTEAMTLGDRVAVMRRGVLQQVGAPAELYDKPANEFVAGFIGSPAMNFLPARVEAGVVRLPFGEVPLRGELARALARHREGGGAEVTAGIRPDRFEDPRFEREDEPGRLRFHTRVEAVEMLGSELYAYLPAPDVGEPIVARLNASSRARAGEEIELSLDTTRITLFDPDTGRTIGRTSASVR